MVRLDTVRLVVATIVSKGWKMFQLDVKLSFLNGTLEDEVYIE